MSQTEEYGSLIEQGVASLKIQSSTEKVNNLLGYLNLIKKWSHTYNLTAIRTGREMVIQHLLDSLAVLPYINCSRIIDVGSGAGLPGIPLAIMNPALDITTLDSSEKKVRFMRQVIIELNLKNVQAVSSRAEDYRPSGAYEIVISRAFASLGNFSNATGHLCTNHGQLFAMKGKYPANEVADLHPEFQIVDSHSLTVPGLNAERTLIVMQRVAES